VSAEDALLEGVILYDKPAGITSSDVVTRVRRELGGRGAKVGHAGTLDPFATGLLLILVGRATRVQRFLMALPKRYEAVARFGATSTTGDPEGEIIETGVVPQGDLELPTGRLRQRPPAYSAVKVAGRRAYALARAGAETLVLPEREIEVHRFEETWRAEDRRGFAIECSSGTYVRSLIAALGDAYCEQLRRTAIGAFEVAAADPERVIPLPRALEFLPEVRVGPEHARRAGHGVSVPAGADAASSAVVRLTGEDGLIALAEPREGGAQLKPIVGFSPPVRDATAGRC
jgi:tRNA pseudouridine55 synthase